MYDARVISNAILDVCATEKLILTNLQLQKLLYLAHGYFLRREGRPLVNGGFEAWGFGPVSRVAYDAFKKYGDLQIVGRAKRFDPITRKESLFDVSIEDAVLFTVEDVVRWFGSMSAFNLVELTHAPDTPWSVTVDSARRKPNVGMIISDSLIAAKFEGPEFT